MPNEVCSFLTVLACQSTCVARLVFEAAWLLDTRRCLVEDAGGGVGFAIFSGRAGLGEHGPA